MPMKNPPHPGGFVLRQCIEPLGLTITAAPDESVPAPVLSAALYERFNSRGQDDFAHKMLSALRYQFGGHKEEAATKKGCA
jgi:6-phosphogluconate dehydrogenase